MPIFKNPSFVFRLRVLVLVLLAFIPIYLLMVYIFTVQRNLVLDNSKLNAGRFIEIIKQTQTESINDTKTLLDVLSRAPDIYDSDEACSSYLKGFLQSYSRYTNLGVLDKDGNLLCDGLETDRNINNSDRKYFMDAKSTGQFAIGNYQIGRATGKPGINFGYPVMDVEGNLEYVVFAAVGLDSIDNIAQNVKLPVNSSFSILDADGTVLTHRPEEEDGVGSMPKETALVEVLKANKEGVWEAFGSDRIYSYSWLGDNKDAPLAYLAIGIDKSALYARANSTFAASLLFLSVFGLFGLVIAWFFSGKLVAKEAEYVKQIEQAENRSRRLNETLQFLNKILRHDIMNDLTVIRSYISTYKNYATSGVGADEIFSEIEKSVDKSMLLMEKMREVEMAIGSGEGLSGVDVRLVAEEAKRRHTDLNIDIEGSGRALADPALYLVFDNILTDSQKYGEASSVKILVDQTESGLLITFSDDGKGVPGDLKRSVVSPDFAHETEGNRGLGIYIVKKTVTRYGGIFSISDNHPIGSVYSIKLPSFAKIPRPEN